MAELEWVRTFTERAINFQRAEPSAKAFHKKATAWFPWFDFAVDAGKAKTCCVDILRDAEEMLKTGKSLCHV